MTKTLSERIEKLKKDGFNFCQHDIKGFIAETIKIMEEVIRGEEAARVSGYSECA